MARRGLLLYWIIQKLTNRYERLQVERDKKRKREQASVSDSESEPESASPEIRPLPDNQYHVIYTRHSRSHFQPTPMHLVEFIGEGEKENQMDLAVHENLLAVCSCNKYKDPDDATVWLYRNDPMVADGLPLLEEGEHFLGAPEDTVAITSAGILYSFLSPDDWTGQVKSYLGVPPVLLSGIDELSGGDELMSIKAHLMENVVNHRDRFNAKSSPASTRRNRWEELEKLREKVVPPRPEERRTKTTQVQPDSDDKDKPKRISLPTSAGTSLGGRQGGSSHIPRNIPPIVSSARERPQGFTVGSASIPNSQSSPWVKAPEHDYLYLSRDIPMEQWGLFGLDTIDPNHMFNTSRPLTRGEVRILTMHQNLGQSLYATPTTIEDTLDMAREGWNYPNLNYPEAMTMLQSISYPEILGKELNDCVLAWRETKDSGSMFNQSADQKESSLNYASEMDLLKQNHASRYIKDNAPTLDRPLKEVSPAALDLHFRACIKYGMQQGMHYKLWHIIYGAGPNIKPYALTVKKAAAQYPKYKTILEKMASFWVLSLRVHASQNVDYQSKRKEYLSQILSMIQKGDINGAMIHLQSEADVLKAYNPCYAAEEKQGDLTEIQKTKGTDREIRTALLSLLSSDDAPLQYIWKEMVSTHLRENPSGFNRGASSVQNLELADLLARFKNACEMDVFLKEQRKKPSLGVYNSKTSQQKNEPSSNNPRCDKCKALDLPCSPHLNHCREKGHQKDQDFKNTSPKSFHKKTSCPHCVAFLQKNIHQSQREGQLPSAPLAPPPEKAKCDKCMFLKKSCLPKFRHCRKMGHQANQPQSDTTPASWNITSTCPFCAKEKNPKAAATSFKEPPPLIPSLPTMSSPSLDKGWNTSPVRPPLPTPLFPQSYVRPFSQRNKNF